MNRHVVFGSGLAALIVGTTLVLAGGAPSVATPVPVQGKPLPGLTPMMETNANAVPAQVIAPPAPASSHP